MYFIKLAILIFGCPRDRYITNFTRKPLVHSSMKTPHATCVSVYLHFCVSVFLFLIRVKGLLYLSDAISWFTLHAICISVFLHFCISLFLYFLISVFLYFCSLHELTAYILSDAASWFILHANFYLCLYSCKSISLYFTISVFLCVSISVSHEFLSPRWSDASQQLFRSSCNIITSLSLHIILISAFL